MKLEIKLATLLSGDLLCEYARIKHVRIHAFVEWEAM